MLILTRPRWVAILRSRVQAWFVCSAGEILPSVVDELGLGVLIAFCTGEIVPPEALGLFDHAFNFHGGPPEYPGRDPHHWAIWDGAAEFGVTVHRMTESVDAGPIVYVERFPIVDEPQALRRYAEGRLLAAFNLVVDDLAALVPTGDRWGPRKNRRADIPPDDGSARWRRAFGDFRADRHPVTAPTTRPSRPG